MELAENKEADTTSQGSTKPDSFKVSPRIYLRRPIQEMGISATLEMSLKVKEYRSQGIDITNFGLGESPFGAPLSVQQTLGKQADRTSYYPSQGIAPLREKISEFYRSYFDLNCHPNQIIVGPGSKELLFHTMLALDSSWFFISPSWVSYETQAKMLGRHFWRVRTRSEDNFRLTADLLRKKYREVADDPRADNLIMLINYPNNPTGMTVPKDEVKRIARFARNNEILILSDEIYANVTHHDQEHHSFALEYPEGTIVTGGISKDRSLGGYRLGVAVLPDNDKLIKAYRSIASETYSSVSAPIQHSAIAAYDLNDDIKNHIADSTAIHSMVGSEVYRQLEGTEFRVAPPEGAFYLMPSLNHKKAELLDLGISNSKQLVNFLLDNYKLAVIGGSAFNLPNENLAFRMAYIDYDGREVLQSFRDNREASLADPAAFVRENCPSVVKGLKRLQQFSDDHL